MSGLTVVVIGWDREARAPKREVREDGTVVYRIRAWGRFGGGLANVWGLTVFNLGLVGAAVLLRPRVFHAVDMDTAFGALVAKWVLGSRFFYDIADPYWLTRPRDERLRRTKSIRWLLRLLQRMEEWVVRHADCVCVPHEARLDLYARRPSQYVIVHNSPEDAGMPAWEGRRKGGYFVYLGGLYEDRGVRTMIEAARRATVPVVLGGFGPLEDMCRRAACGCENVTFVGLVTNREALRVQAGSLAVLALYDPALMTNRLAAPTKVYEAMMLGRPVIVAGETLPAKLVEEEKIGVVVAYGDEEELARAMRHLWENREVAEEMGRRARALYESKYRWETQCAALRLAYENLLRDGRCQG